MEMMYDGKEIVWKINQVEIKRAEVKPPPEGDCYRACAVVLRQIRNTDLITVVEMVN